MNSQAMARLLTVAGATAVVAREDGRAAIDGSCRDGTGVQTVVERIHLVCKSLGNELILSSLRCCELSLRELTLQRGVLSALVIDLTLVPVKLKLAELIYDGLRLCGVIRDDVTNAVRQSCTVGTVLGKDGRGLLGVSELDVRSELCRLHLARVEALHHAHLRAVEALINGVLRRVEAVTKGIVHASETVGKRHLHVSTALAELGSEVLALRLDTLQGGLNHLVAESTVDVLGIVEPRVKFVTTYITSTSSVVVASVVSVETSEEDE